MKRSLSFYKLVMAAAVALPSMALADITPATPQLDDEDGCYMIGTAAELYGFAAMVNGGKRNVCGKLTDDIVVNENVLENASGASCVKNDGSYNTSTCPPGTLHAWTPIGAGGGTFYGQGHTISGLFFNGGKNEDAGLFGITSGEVVIDGVGLVDSYFKADFAGGFVSNAQGEVYIRNSFNLGYVNGIEYGGGFFGSAEPDVSRVYVYNSYNAGSVNMGGKLGSALAGYCEGCYINGFYYLAGSSVGDYGESKTTIEFADGTVAELLHDWCEKDGGDCKEGGLDGSVWGQNLAKKNSLPDLSGEIAHKYGGIVFRDKDDDKFDEAYVDATSELAVEIPDDIVVSGPIKFKRTFAGSGYSTIMLPFTPNCTKNDCVEGVTFFEFVSYKDATVGVSEVSPSALQANTPYLIQAAGATEIVFKDGGTFNTTTGDAYDSETGLYKKVLAGEGAGWTIYGTYKFKTWAADDTGLGKTYGFAGLKDNDPLIVGQFAKIGVGAYIYPMRAYLKYGASVLNRPLANGETPRNVNASLPETIDVMVVEGNETTGEQTTRVIGSLDTRTGEFKFATDRWFDLNGRYLGSKKPMLKGAYYNNGKKVIIK